MRNKVIGATEYDSILSKVTNIHGANSQISVLIKLVSPLHTKHTVYQKFEVQYSMYSSVGYINSTHHPERSNH